MTAIAAAITGVAFFAAIRWAHNRGIDHGIQLALTELGLDDAEPEQDPPPPVYGNGVHSTHTARRPH